MFRSQKRIYKSVWLTNNYSPMLVPFGAEHNSPHSKNGLVPLYDENEEYKKLVRGLAALSFLRVEQVRHGFDFLRARALLINVPNNAMSIFDYFEWFYFTEF